MPDAQDLNAAIGMRQNAEKELQRAEEERTRAKKTEQNRKFVLSTLERECREAAAGLPYARTVADYQEASDNAAEYHDTLSTTGRALTELHAAASENFQKNHDFLHSYRPKLDLFFDKPETPSLLRQRQRVTLSVNGKEMSRPVR